MANKERINGLDAYRILAAFLVVLVHCTNVTVCSKGSWQEGSLWFLHLLALCCVNCFGLLTGYLGGSLKHRFSSYLGLWVQVLFYLIVIYALTKCGIAGGAERRMYKLLPILGGEYWYFTAYTIVVILLPLLRKGIDSLSQKEFKAVCLGMLGVSVLPSVMPWGPLYSFGFNYGHTALWLVVLYMTGAYLRKYPRRSKWLTSGKCLLYAISLPVIGAVLHQIYYAGYVKGSVLNFVFREVFNVAMYDAFKGEYCVMYYTHPLIYFEAVFLLLAFSQMNLPTDGRLTKLVNISAPYAFGVYLAHNNTPFTVIVKEPMLQWCRNQSLYLYPFLLCGVVLLITTGCGCIDFLRALLFKFVGRFISYARCLI